jgi:hypothetical protein
MNVVRRLPIVVTIMVVGVLGLASPASAHTVSGVGATNYSTTLGALTPPVAGLSVRVIENGSRLQLTNRSGVEVMVLGYQDEPYLRVGPAGVFQNQRSPATYLNATRLGTTTPPPDASATAAPLWHKISSGQVARWHDHRIHWMGLQPPPNIRRHPGNPALIDNWTINLRQNGRPITVTGSLSWVPGPSAIPWLIAIVVLLAGAVVGARSRRWALTTGVAATILVVTDALHAGGIGFAYAGSLPHRSFLVLGASYYSLVAWIVGLIGVRLLLRRSIDGLFAVTFAALIIALFGGLSDASVLNHSSVPFAFPAVVERVLVTAALGLGFGTVIGAVMAFRRNRPEQPEALHGAGAGAGGAS